MDNNDLREISKKLSVLIALNLGKNDKFSTVKEKIVYLKTFSLGNGEIAEILTTTKHSVEVVLDRLKNKKE